MQNNNIPGSNKTLKKLRTLKLRTRKGIVFKTIPTILEKQIDYKTHMLPMDHTGRKAQIWITKETSDLRWTINILE